MGNEFVNRPWGGFKVLFQTDNTWVKVLYVEPGQSLSLQYHTARIEHWIPQDDGLTAEIGGTKVELSSGDIYTIGLEVTHRISNPSNKVVSLIEVATGEPREDDIVRLEDNYGRADAS